MSNPLRRAAPRRLASACLVLLLAGCGDPAVRPDAARAPAARNPSRAATAPVAGDAHPLYAAKGFACEACHPCGVRSPDGHAAAWMDQASTGFHAFQADVNLAGCTRCHGPALDGVGGTTVVSCGPCHGAAWRTDCTMCHGTAGGDGAPPRTIWGRASDAVRVGAHAAHLSASHGLSQPVACTSCHVVPADALAGGHADGANATVTFSGIGGITGPLPAAWDRTSATCSNVYCHGATLPAGARRTPAWTSTDPAQRACDACHGNPPPKPHVANPACGSCHPGYGPGSVNAATHVDGKVDVAGLGCTSCHGSGTSAAPPIGTGGETATTAIAVGAHERHLGGGAVSNPIACTECHVVPAQNQHANGVVELAFGPLATRGGAQPLWDRGTATCSSTYCHGQFAGGDLLNLPVWTIVNGTQAACGTCHGTPPPAPHPENAACERCHPGYTATSVSLATHVNGQVEYALDCTSCHGSALNAAPPVGTHGETATTARAVGAHQAHLAGGTLGPAVACGECHPVPATVTHADGTVQVTFGARSRTNGATPAWDPATLTCTGTYCHGAVLRGGNAIPAPSWTGGKSQVACGACHGMPPPAPHPHTAICENCHPGYTLTSVNLATHMNGKVEAENLTCSSCHGDDTRVLTMGADPLAIAAPPYGSRGETSTTTRSVGQHQRHVNTTNDLALPNKCRYCHVVPTTFDHANGTSEVAFGSLSTMGGANPTFDGNTCRNTYCHGATLNRGGTDHDPRWIDPVPVNCGSCHGVPPPLPHPQDSDCIRCHPGYTATSVRKWTHVNGISDFPSGCNSCHDDPPNTGAHYEHLHERIDCDRCHAGYTMTTENKALHRNAVQDVTLAGWNATTRTCTNVGCHGSEYWGRNGEAARLSCNQCHGVPPRSGEHYEHSEYACSRCHGTGYSTTTTNPTTHMNGVVDVPFGFYDRATLGCGSGAGSCHGSERWGSRSPVTPNCGNCHGFPPPLPHPQDSACQSCHPSMLSTGVLTTAHNNGTLDLTGAGCEACHGFPPASTRSGGVHPADPNCYGCHSTTVNAQNQIVPDGTHNDGFVQVGGGGVGTYGCQSCHGDQARQAPAGADPNVKSAPPLGTRGETEATTRAVGAHQAHVNPAVGFLASPALCSECHPVPTAMDHANGIAQNVFGGRAILGGAAPVFDEATLSCSSTYCHGATLGAGGTNHAPFWEGGTGQAGCGSCHGVPPPPPHTAATNCEGCHPGYTATSVNVARHVNGVVDVATSCHSCHGSAQNDAPPAGTHGETATTARAVGAHQAHVRGGTLRGAIACGECHPVPGSLSHSDGAVQLSWGSLARTGGASPAWNGTTCSSTYCHGATLSAGGSNTAPAWTTVDGTQDACGSCHGAPPPAPHTASTACGSCHTGYTATSVNLATHIDGIVQHASYHSAGWADKAQHGYQANLTGLAGCKSCHGADLAGGTSGVSCAACHAAAGFAAWDTSCTFCHGSRTTGRQNPPLDIQGRSVATNVSVGVHEAHATTAIATFVACAQCHPARTASVVTDAAHVDGNGIAEVAFGTLAKTGGVTPTYTRSSETSASCAATYCHGNFSGGAKATVSWTSTAQVGCASCHGNPPSSGRHGTHQSKSVKCYNCHNAVVSSTNAFLDKSLHVNGAKNVKMGGTYNSRTVTGAWNATSRSCSSLSCHGSASW